ELRPVAHIESRRRKLYVATRWRHRDFELSCRKHVCGFRSSAAGKSIPSARRGIYERLGNQQHTWRCEWAAFGCGRRAGICGGEGHLRRRIRKTSRRAGKHRDGFGRQSAAWSGLRISAEQRVGCAKLLRSWRYPGLPAQRVWRLAGRAAAQGQELSVWELRGLSPEFGAEQSLAGTG